MAELKDIKPNIMPVATISNPFSPEEEKANAEYRAMTRRAGEAMRVLAKDGTSTPKNTEHQEALLGDARSIAEAKIAKTLKAAVDGAKLQADASEHAIETFARDFKRGVMLDLWENYVPRSPHQAELNLDFEAFSLAVCGEGRLSINRKVDSAVRKCIEMVATVAQPTAVEENGAGKGRKHGKPGRRNRVRDEFDKTVREMRELGYTQERMCEELTLRAVKPSDISENAKWRKAPSFTAALKDRVFKSGVKKFLSEAGRPR